ncbi:DNA ligase D [Nitrosomonas sp. Nm166]|uniref:DNA ligase D n=1 Tax=Nitrosomonas sp. Nm166 TaxID=1881054 RepID=UPI0008E58570|nr:DNA ligase D [Nitrosomonas sp. Nm166]SFE92173.1 bifunctional non-homologous end joining protein LigD [Nitrosomonas sp. Nm166]
MADLLSKYHQKRDFSITGEPKGKAGKRKNTHLAFVIQKHGARRLHYDFRLELDGVMKSWAVTRGPSYDPTDKRLAVHVEDHPMEYNQFEGIIPDKQYGAGPVMIWDHGEWVPEEDPHESLKKGHLTFQMKGKRMHGRWHLVRMNTSEKRENWLLIKGDDEFVLKGGKNERFLDEENTSIISNRTLEEIKNNVTAKPQKETQTRAEAASTPVSDLIVTLQKKYPKPELAILAEFPPTAENWWHEIKYDGYRIMVFLENGHVILRTRSHQDWTHKFQAIANQLTKIKVKNAVLDGELCVLNEKGVTDFSALQDALSRGDSNQIGGWFFDLLHLNDEDYTQKPLSERKTVLRKLLRNKRLSLIHYSEHLESSPHLLKKACQIGAEGLVSKNKDSPYLFRRTHDWIKSKCGQEQEFVIGGFIPAKDHPEAVGSLLLGYYKQGKFLYAGKVGTGFGVELSKKIYQRLNSLRTNVSPFNGRVEKSRRAHYWVQPQIVCNVSFWEWTADQRIRHSSFKGLREDKAPTAVHQEIPEKPAVTVQKKSLKSNFRVEGVIITHPDREVFPGIGITKGDIATHYARVMPFILPFVENRLISLLRCTNTIEGQCFFQRNPMPGMGTDIIGKTITHQGSKHNYLYIDNAEGLLELVQMGTIEFHVWQSEVKNIGKPDQIIFDLDPGENVPFDAIKLAAEDIRRRLRQLDLESFPRLSGGKGIHVAVPLKPKHAWDEIKKFTQKFARRMERDMPDVYVATMAKTKRAGKIFIDYLRNDYSSTAIAPFSLRARRGAPVAMPLFWQELNAFDSAAAFNILNIRKKLNKATEEKIQDFFDSRQDLKFN